MNTRSPWNPSTAILDGLEFNSVTTNFDTNFKPEPKLFVIGHGQHGKDAVCEIIVKRLGWKYKSSSLFCIEKFIFEQKGEEWGYSTALEMYENRHKHRAELHDLISEYSKDDKTRLSRAILAENNIYCGIRCDKEFLASKYLAPSIWVDASLRMPLEGKDSMKLEEYMADITVDNNGPLSNLETNVFEALGILGII